MSEQKSSKLNHLQILLPEGVLVTTAWLVAHGYPRSLLAKYAQRGWLESPARGVYRRPGPPLKWQHVVGSLQNLLQLPVHVGGRTALEMQGHAHYLRLGPGGVIFLYSAQRLPRWVGQVGVQERFVIRSDRLFAEPEPAPPGRLVAERTAAYELADPQRVGLTTVAWGSWDSPLTHSTLERACMEMLDEVPHAETVEDADAMMQGLTTLSPRRVTALLEACRSVKVKRLFLALAERRAHAWFKHLDLSAVDLGRGKRALVPGGKLSVKYRITLPRSLDGDTE
ncbi:MAG: type IV toxin-antitoxin system AbiEi family antitoxin domain-containing protein [Burkholderiales bacterium]